ncbi:SSS family solute:Na+ symporter [Motilibacter rhizosphaerae]|uniref:SSS family solute:Na+ symporter n=1 Tax=Motilibacter rhizosphaerae TaxID=598652 RepID=A0A4Q7NUS5_9ACTN|nr:sodium:solute symporter [Motilibacter rhizosphaerae]RZS90963.1 SSS family solute:Na+ symporter [Motilibacter rhizosphaerae]
MNGVDGVALTVFILLFVLVTGLGFVASRWHRAESLEHLDEWGLGGRSFGPWVTWFLLGGDLYTAYTFVAVPALMYGAGATGFFALPYTIVLYPLAFLVAPRLWSVAHRHGYVTPADVVRGRHGSALLALLVALTGIVATMPYIALQLVGIEAVLKVMGVKGEWPLIVAFVVLAAYTYQAGLRAPALIAFVKDALIYLVIIVAFIAIPIQLHGFGSIFSAAEAKFAKTPAPTDGILLSHAGELGYSTLALGSAMALFIYPHSVTGLLASRSRRVIRRNMSMLPAYSFVLGLLALLGFMAIAAGVKPLGKDTDTVVPLLFDKQFPSWFAGIAYAAIGIGALVPAAIMSIAAANLFTRNIYREFVRPDATPAEEARVSKLMSLVVKAGAVVAILALDPQFSIDLQLIGGVLILQTLPALVGELLTRWFHRFALTAGLVVGLAVGVWMLWVTPNPAAKKVHFGGSQYAFAHLGFDTKVTVYTGLAALVVNLLVAVVLTPVLRAARVADGADRTTEEDYLVEAGDPRVAPVAPVPGV